MMLMWCYSLLLKISYISLYLFQSNTHQWCSWRPPSLRPLLTAAHRHMTLKMKSSSNKSALVKPWTSAHGNVMELQVKTLIMKVVSHKNGLPSSRRSVCRRSPHSVVLRVHSRLTLDIIQPVPTPHIFTMLPALSRDLQQTLSRICWLNPSNPVSRWTTCSQELYINPLGPA